MNRHIKKENNREEMNMLLHDLFFHIETDIPVSVP